MNEYLIRDAQIYAAQGLRRADLLIKDGKIEAIGPQLNDRGAVVLPFAGCVVFPGLTDVHVHFREPGFSYKETMVSGSCAAARGGFTSVCTMPNVSPCPDTLEHLQVQQALIDAGACVHVYPFGAITMGRNGKTLSDMRALRTHVVGFSDDGSGVQNETIMHAAMEQAAALGKVISAHCEDNTLLHGGYIHNGAYARAHGHRGICSESEWGQIARDLKCAKQTGCRYHVCHISCKESVELIRQAKADGVDVTCETAPHYLILTDADLQEDGRFKMNPPLRTSADREALIEGVADGTIDMIATDHAPHSAAEKAKGLEHSAMGVVGLETAFAACYTYLVKMGRITLDCLIERLHDAPRRRFGIGSDLAVGQAADLTVFDLTREWEVNPDHFLSKGRATPFAGMKLYGTCMLTMVGGRIVWQA